MNVKSPAVRVWMPVALLWLVACLNYLDRLMITTMRDPIKASIQMTDAQFGLLTSVFLWVYAVLSPFAGYIADRFSRSAVILASLVVWSGVTWLTGHVRTFEELLAARAMMGISEACYVPAALALINDYHRGPTRSLATGLHMSGIYAGAALGGIGGVIAEHFGWRAGFNIFGFAGIGYAVVLAFLLRDANGTVEVGGEVRPHPAPLPRERESEDGRVGKDVSCLDEDGAATVRREPNRALETVPLLLGEKAGMRANVPTKVSAKEAMAKLFSKPAFLLLLALNALVGVANWGINGWLPTYLKDHFQMGLGAAGMSATGYIQVASFFGVLIGGAWADRLSRRTPRGRSIVPAIGYIVAGPCLFLAATTDTLFMAICGLVVFGLGRGFFDANLMPIQRQVADERYSATGYGFLNFISCIAGGVMIYAGGWLQDARISLATVFQISAAGLVIVALLLFALKPRR